MKDPTQKRPPGAVEINFTDAADRVRLTVVATESPEPIDFDAWAARYVRLAIAAYRAQRDSEAPPDLGKA